LGSVGINLLRDFSHGLNGSFKGPGEPAWRNEIWFGMALDFDGINDYVQVSDSSLLRPSHISITMWGRPDSFPSYFAPVIKTTSDAWQDGYGLASPNVSGRTIRFWVKNYSLPFPTYTLTAGDSYLIAGTYNGASVCLYVNGSLIGSYSYTSPISHSFSPLRLGSHAGLYCWDGSIGAVSVYNRALSAAEVWQLWDPATRWDLYRPLVRRLWHVPVAAGRVGVYGRRRAVALPGGVQIRGI
jgi:hypothetical protein